MNQETWHASPSALDAYASGRASDGDAWSVEAHLVGCRGCRTELAAVVASAPGSARDAQLLTGVRAQLLDDIGRARRTVAVRRARWHLGWVVRPSSLVAVVVAVVAAVVVATASGWHAGRPGGQFDTARWLLWLLAPAVPLGGVALCSLDDRDGAHEAELATPSAGWRLVLWRTGAVVVTAVPLALAAGWAMTALPGPEPAGPAADPGDPWLAALWLLPGLALVTAALAVGTWLALPRAAALVAVVWTAAVLAPVVLRDSAAVPPLEAAVWSLHLLSGGAQPVWALLLAAAAAVVAVRREAFGRAPDGIRTTRPTTRPGTAPTRGARA